MPDHKELYLKMMRAAEAAIRILTQTQQECEELYLNAPEPTLTVLYPSDAADKTTQGRD